MCRASTQKYSISSFHLWLSRPAFIEIFKWYVTFVVLHTFLFSWQWVVASCCEMQHWQAETCKFKSKPLAESKITYMAVSAILTKAEISLVKGRWGEVLFGCDNYIRGLTPQFENKARLKKARDYVAKYGFISEKWFFLDGSFTEVYLNSLLTTCPQHTFILILSCSTSWMCVSLSL